MKPTMHTTTNPAQPEGTFRLAARLLWQFMRGQYPRLIVGLAVMTATAAAAVLQPWPLKMVLDNVVGDLPMPGWMASATQWLSSSTGASDAYAALSLLVGAMIAIHLLCGLLGVASTWLLVSVGLRMVFTLRCRLFEHIQRLSLRFHDTNSVGDSLYRVTWDTYSIQSLLNGGLIPAINALVMLAMICSIMLRKDWALTLVALTVGLPLAFLVRRMDRPMSDFSTRASERESDISTQVQETLGGIRAVQAFSRERIETERFRVHADESLKANLRLTILQSASGVVVSVLLAAGTGAVIWIAASRVLSGRLTPGDVVLLSAYVGMLYKPLETLTYTATTVQGAVAKARRILSILDAEPDVRDAADARPLPARADGHVVFDGVTFAYEPGRNVLDHVSLDIPPRTTVALVGASGAGKTTLASLLPRFYDPDAGRVLLDGQDLRQITLASLRDNVSVVLQEPVLFAATIFENIAYGRPDATPEAVEAAARAAGAHEFITALPGGYDTRLGERGVSLSGGQRQRISIARAFLKDSPVLVMDEPTSALDAATEAALLESLNRLKQGRTTLIVAHRLSTIRDADVIVVLDRGRIIETGSHWALMEQDGPYAKLYNGQFARTDRRASTSVN